MYWESPTQPPCRELHIAWGWRSEDLLEQAWLKVRLIGEVVFWGLTQIGPLHSQVSKVAEIGWVQGGKSAHMEDLAWGK